ncbi:hypothetical protein [Undibacterium sp.]|jgi:hypothetical protein|uniref:hypothetical protein n=1 Tax=Undibacterium sp. TaxID=1914977 RepID=UPI002BF3D81F|nr:hypothetical protein [Undibacterium sp.]HTD02652.1 hypothetical protein [Undibacterium sp.]
MQTGAYPDRQGYLKCHTGTVFLLILQPAQFKIDPDIMSPLARRRCTGRINRADPCGL